MKELEAKTQISFTNKVTTPLIADGKETLPNEANECQDMVSLLIGDSGINIAIIEA